MRTPAVSSLERYMRTTKRRRFQRGFTIIEVIVIVVILGVLAAIIAPRLFSRIGQSKQAVARTNGMALANAMKMYILDHGKPESGATLSILWERPASVEEANWEPYIDSPDALLDPWGNPYILIMPGQKNVDFDIKSLGDKGQDGGTGEEEDVVVP